MSLPAIADQVSRERALIVVPGRAGLRIGEALDLAETDLDVSRGAVLLRRGKGGRRRKVGMDRWAWSQILRCGQEQVSARHPQLRRLPLRRGSLQLRLAGTSDSRRELMTG